MFTKTWMKDTAERVLATAVVTFGSALVGTAAVADVNWKLVGWTTGLAAFGTLMKCMAASGKSDTVSPASLVK